MLRAYVDYIFVILKHLAGNFLHLPVAVFNITYGVVFIFLVVLRDRIQFRVGVIILAERVSLPVITQKETTHIRMIDKLDSKRKSYTSLS